MDLTICSPLKFTLCRQLAECFPELVAELASHLCLVPQGAGVPGQGLPQQPTEPPQLVQRPQLQLGQLRHLGHWAEHHAVGVLGPHQPRQAAERHQQHGHYTTLHPHADTCPVWRWDVDSRGRMQIVRRHCPRGLRSVPARYTHPRQSGSQQVRWEVHHCHCCLGSAVRLQNELNMKRDMEILSSNKCQLKIVSLNGFSSVSLKYASSFKKVSLPT